MLVDVVSGEPLFLVEPTAYAFFLKSVMEATGKGVIRVTVANETREILDWLAFLSLRTQIEEHDTPSWIRTCESSLYG